MLAGASEHLRPGRLIHRLTGNGAGARLLRTTGFTFALTVLGTAMAFATHMLLARAMGVGQYGMYIYALGWINLLVLPATLGYTNAVVRFVPAYRAKAEFGLLKGIFLTSFRHAGIMAVAAAAGMLVITELLEGRIRHELAITLQVAALILPVLALTNVRAAILRGLHNVIKAILVTNIIRSSVLLLFVLSFYLLSGARLSAPWMMGVNLAGAVLGLATAMRWASRALPAQVHQEVPRFATRYWLLVAVPLVANGAMNMVIQQSDMLMLGILSSTDAAGIYAVTTRLATLSLFGLVAVNSVMAPMISEFYVNRDMQRLQKVLARGAWMTAAVALPGALLMYLEGRWLLSFFGKEFVVGYVPLATLLVGYLFNALSGSVGFVMTMTGHHRQAFYILAGAAVLNVSLNALLIPQLGMNGAAIATVVAMVGWNGAMIIFVWRRFRLNPTIFAGSPF